mmetsp:Transcript_21968/g.21177  ORF Transcript_21968/g.21177 Transcript_21968/m.21177 type:complete len:135 (+) Transcript_21968:667-1071(+)
MGVSIIIFLMTSVFRGLLSNNVLLSSHTILSRKISERVLRAKVLFFDSNPSGRILTRFSKDFMLLDNLITLMAIFTVTGIMRSFSIAITNIVVNPYSAIPFVACLVLFGIIFKHMRVGLREALRFDSYYRGPLH